MEKMHKWTVSGISPANQAKGREAGYIDEPTPVSYDSWNEASAREYARHLYKSGFDSVVIKHIITEFVTLDTFTAED